MSIPLKLHTLNTEYVIKAQPNVNISIIQGVLIKVTKVTVTSCIILRNNCCRKPVSLAFFSLSTHKFANVEVV